MNQLRLYTFVNFYLSSIQQGIQSAHVGQDLTATYRGQHTKAAQLLKEWEDHGKTMIVLNGGTAADILQAYESMHDLSSTSYPYTAFWEEPGAIHESAKAVTAWGVVLPPEVYNAQPIEVFPNREGFSIHPAESFHGVKGAASEFWEPGSFEHAICSYLQGKHLAR